MSSAKSFKKGIFHINERNFESHCINLFAFQYLHNSLYRKYCHLLAKNPDNVRAVSQIPFLPIEFFKNHVVKTGHWKEEKVFMSSGTTHAGKSKHFIRDLAFYQCVTRKCFENAYNSLSDMLILALLPSYLAQGDSSLIAMMDFFMREAMQGSNYYLNNLAVRNLLISSSCHKLLIGVSYALLDLAENGRIEVKNTQVMETGGMKGRRKEITREELHGKLKVAFSTNVIHSEYGMTELMSQAYGTEGHFRFPKWAKVLIRDINDPFCYLKDHKTGGINIIDLANVDTCAFIETKDLGRTSQDTFEVLGRFDNAEIRGCNLIMDII